MTLYEFQHLTRCEQIDVIWNISIMIAERKDDYYIYTLHSLESFYIELRFKGDFLIGIKSFSNTDFLAPYLQAISIPEGLI